VDAVAVGDHYVLVDEADPDDDATYVETETSTTSTLRLCGCGDHDTIVGVQLSVNVKKTIKATPPSPPRIRYRHHRLRRAVERLPGALRAGGLTEYYYVDFPWDTHPTGAAWTPHPRQRLGFGFIKTR